MTAASHKPNWETGQVIDVTPQVEGKKTPPSKPVNLTSASNSTQNSSSNTAIVQTKGTFSEFLAPLTKDTFKQVVTDVEKKLEVVNQTLSMLDSMLDSQGFDSILNEMLRSITLKTGELLNADRSTIYLLDEEKNELWSIVAKDEKGNNLELRFPATVGIAGEVATTKKTVNIAFDFYDDPRSTAAKKFDEKNKYRTFTMLVLPLLNEDGGLVAVVQLINKLKKVNDPDAALIERIDTRGFTQEDEAVFADFAPSIRLILESSRSFYKATQKQRAASALMAAIESLSKSSLDLEDTLGKVMDEAKTLMNADRSTLWLLDHEKNQLWTKIPIQGKLTEMRIPRNAGFAGQVAESHEPLLIPFDAYEQAGAETAKKTDQKTGYRTCSMLCMPVFNADNDLIGVTQLVNKKKQGDYPAYNPEDWPNAPECWKASFNRADLEFMRAFNIQAGVALQNAKLFAEVKQQEQMQKDILRSISNAIISTDKTGHIIAANENAKKLLGLAEEEKIEGKDIKELVILEKGDFGKWLSDGLVGDNPKSRAQYYPEQTLISTKEEQHSINLSINTIADAIDHHNVNGVLVVMEDISNEKRLKSTMYRYMTQEVAEQLLASGDTGLGGKRKKVSVLFSDIRSYTTLSEGMSAEEVVEMLNEYFERMVDAVFKYKGTLDKYIGDAIMAVFGSPLPLADHEWCAVQTAVEMRHRLARFNKERLEIGKKEISIGIGIHSDEVVSGNIGSSKRMELTSIGDGVNLGSRLEGTSKMYGTDIVISDKTYEPCRDKVYARELDFITVKGKSEPVVIYELVGLRGEPIEDSKLSIMEHYNKGREYYRRRQFAQALAEFGQVQEIDKKNKAAILHIERCTHFLDTPPPDDWNGVWVLTEK